MATCISHSPAQTEALGERLGRQARTGWVIGLVGDLGAGKTQFVKGFARGLGVHDLVLSPTFALLHQYSTGRLPLFHIDFYRLENDQQIRSAGLTEYFAPDGVTLIEWWERWTGPSPDCFYSCVLETLGETDRRITYDDPGA